MIGHERYSNGSYASSKITSTKSKVTQKPVEVQQLESDNSVSEVSDQDKKRYIVRVKR